MKGEDSPPGRTDGRPPSPEKPNRKSVPVSTVNGRPEATSTIGATVKLAKNFLIKLSPECESEIWKTPLVTQRCRWSKLEFERSRFGKRLSCGSSHGCKSVELSIAGDPLLLHKDSASLGK